MNAASNTLAGPANAAGATGLFALCSRILAAAAGLVDLWPLAVILVGVGASVAWTGLLAWFAYLALAYLVS